MTDGIEPGRTRVNPTQSPIIDQAPSLVALMLARICKKLNGVSDFRKIKVVGFVCTSILLLITDLLLPILIGRLGCTLPPGTCVFSSFEAPYSYTNARLDYTLRRVSSLILSLNHY